MQTVKAYATISETSLYLPTLQLQTVKEYITISETNLCHPTLQTVQA